MTSSHNQHPHQNQPNIVDLEEIILAWARAHPLPKDIANKVDYTRLTSADINLQRLVLNHAPPEHERLDRDPRAGALQPRERSHVLFSSLFTNDTDRVQSHHLRTERRTKSTCRITVTRGLSVGLELRLALTPPNPVLSANAGFTSNFSLTNANETCVEEELVWSLDSNIEVQPHTRTRADLVIKEDEYDGRFKVDTILEGAVFVKLRCKHNDSVLTVLSCTDVSQLFTPERGFERLERGKVRFSTVGTCFCRYGIEQKVNLQQLPLVDKCDDCIVDSKGRAY